MQKYWRFVRITSGADDLECIESALNSLGALGTAADLVGLHAGSPVTVTGYFEADETEEDLKVRLGEELSRAGVRPAGVEDVSWGVLESEDWLSRWKERWSPTVTEHLVIAAPWHEVAAGHRTVLRIEPGMAFGTGTHETTRLCLGGIERHIHGNRSFLDVGTGTGILAIAAYRLWHDSREQLAAKANAGVKEIAVAKDAGRPCEVRACDVDSEAVGIARANAVANHAGDIRFFEGSVTASTPRSDIVCANLTAGIITSLLPLLFEKARKRLLLSGILVKQGAAIRQDLRNLGSVEIGEHRDGDWIMFSAGK